MHPVWKTNSFVGYRQRGCLARRPIYRVCVAIALFFLAAIRQLPADENHTLDQFLSRLGLTDLRLTHMVRMLAHESAPEKRAAIARQLADAYAEELVASADEEERFIKLKSRAEKLL